MRRVLTIGIHSGLALVAMIPCILSAQAAPRPRECLDGRLRLVSDLEGAWIAALQDACLRLSTAGDVDPSVRVEVSQHGSGIVLVARLPDGRSAAREVRTPASLVSTLDALVLLPPDHAPVALATSEAALPPPPDVPPVETASSEATDSAGVTSPPAAPAIRFELGTTVGGGTYLHPTYLAFDVGLYAAARISHVAIALTVRWDPVVRMTSPNPSGFEMSSLAIGCAVTRRWDFTRAISLDLGGSANIVAQTQSYQATKGEKVVSETDARLGVLARVFGGSREVRSLSMVEAFFSPERLLHPARLEPFLPHVPAWFVGASTGIAWSPR